ncbi:DUF1499 domain-containing protein [Devosia sp. YIM 151766]|uniref:DUF1499 domain-containing protein n=1 Tax=Devosia sp. YIM 151766 TaxID=3017325 RepID=UPI00255C9733|nr:DUF1499 domain-containing protein [Devosia sp. YIM 151766]WIY53391.1 DUF1499 domain-containing protein [Devosia sp. YIM 151766]
MRIKIRTSKWAIWARRLGSVAVPLVLLPVLMHREGFIDAATFLVLILFAGALAALAVLVSLGALIRLWFSGDQGWSRALAGLSLGLACVAPFGWYGALALRNPPVTDIATAPRSELPLIFQPDTAAMPPPLLLSAAEQGRLFPNAATRDYPLDVIQLFALVDRLVRANGWDVRRRSEPLDFSEEGRINARIVTLPGWQDEAVLLVRPTRDGARVDMRSASIGAPIDFGANGQRISQLLTALDSEVTAFLRDNPNISEPVMPDVVPNPEVETGER